MSNEQFYDEEVAPALIALAERCKERGMSLFASVEYEPECRGSTISLTEDAGLAMKMLRLLDHTGINVDGFAINLIRMCREQGISTDSSMFLSRFTGGKSHE